jgi:hypothetical protein
MLYRVHLAWAGFEITTLVAIVTDWIGTGVKKSTNPTPGASNFHIWASTKIYRILTNLLIFAYLLINIHI